MAYIAVHTGNDHLKSYKIFNFGRLCLRLINNNHNLYFVNKSKTPKISDLIDELSKCDLLITSDTGVMHIADFISLPVIVCFGPTSVIKNKPVKSQSIVLYKKLLCRPCYRYGKIVCENKNRKYECLEIDNEIIFDAVNFLLNSSNVYEEWIIDKNGEIRIWTNINKK